jgi:hypothetical protein
MNELNELNEVVIKCFEKIVKPFQVSGWFRTLNLAKTKCRSRPVTSKSDAQSKSREPGGSPASVQQ